ncbi:MAG: hypothetical protein ACE5K4_12345 [Candidatus Hydrothermarchaeota archaeon]
MEVLDGLDIPYMTPSALIVYLFKKGIITKKDAKHYIEGLKDMISDEEYYLAIKAIGGNR